MSTQPITRKNAKAIQRARVSPGDYAKPPQPRLKNAVHQAIVGVLVEHPMLEQHASHLANRILKATRKARTTDRPNGWIGKQGGLRGPLVTLPDHEPAGYLGIDYAHGSTPAKVAAMSNAQATALADVTHERFDQDRQWGGPEHDEKHDAPDWCEYIDAQLCKLNETRSISCLPVKPGQGMNKNFRKRMVKIAALAVAAIEACDRMAAKRQRKGAAR